MRRHRTNTVLGSTLVFTSLLIYSQSTEAQSLQQPKALATATTAAVPLEHDSGLTPVNYCDSCGVRDTCCSNGCCCCEAVCCPKCIVEDVEKKCWNVESEYVCIPGIRFPWQHAKNTCSCGTNCGCGDRCCDEGCCCCPAPKCGKVRCVNVLEEEKYTCQECGYEWNVQCVCRGKRRCPCGDCHCPGCGWCAERESADQDILPTLAESENLVSPVSRRDQTRKESVASRFTNWLLR